MTKKGKERGRGKQRYRSERIHASFFFPPHPLLRGHRPPHPKPLIYAPFGQFYSLLVFLQIGKPLSPLYTPCIPTPWSFSFVLSLFHSLSFASNFSAIPIIIASRVPRILGLFVICLSSCRHSSPFSQLYYRSIILFHGCFYARRRGKNRHALAKRGSRALLKFRSRSARENGFVADFLRENFQQFSRAKWKWKCAFKKINYRPSFQWTDS